RATEADGGDGPGTRHRRRAGTAPREVRHRDRARGRVAALLPDRVRVPLFRRPSPEGRGPRGPDRALVRILRSRECTLEPVQGSLEGDATEAHAGGRLLARAFPRLLGRALHQPRPDLPTEAAGVPPRLHRGRGDRLHGLPPARHRGETLRPGGGDPGRRDRRDRKRGRNPGPGIEPRGRLPPHRRGVRMVGLLRLMLTEEFRAHTSYSGRLAFLAFPIIITGFSLAIAVTSERLFTYTPFGDAILLLHASVFLYGLSVGAFGFLGRQYLERTNGTRNYVVAIPGILP